MLAQNKVIFVETHEIPVSVILPKRVDPLIGKPRHKKPTDVVFQKDGEDVGIYGKLELLSKGEAVSIYTCAGIRFGLMNSKYGMCGRTLCTARGQKVEALIVDISTEYECQKLVFGKDSLAKNVFPEKKLVMHLENLDWSHTSYSVSPKIDVAVIDSLNKDRDAFYTLAVKTEDGKVCGMFQLDRDEDFSRLTRGMVYKIPQREDSKFSVGENGKYLIDGKTIEGFVVLKAYNAGKNGKSIFRKHKKRTKI